MPWDPQLSHQGVEAAEELRIEPVQVGLLRRAAPGPIGGIRRGPRFAVAHRQADEIEALRAARGEILVPQLPA